MIVHSNLKTFVKVRSLLRRRMVKEWAPEGDNRRQAQEGDRNELLPEAAAVNGSLHTGEHAPPAILIAELLCHNALSQATADTAGQLKGQNGGRGGRNQCQSCPLCCSRRMTHHMLHWRDGFDSISLFLVPYFVGISPSEWPYSGQQG